MASIHRQQRSKRKATSKGVPNGRCIDQDYIEKVVGQRKLPDGRLVNVIRGYSTYLHVTKGRKVRANTGLKFELAHA